MALTGSHWFCGENASLTIYRWNACTSDTLTVFLHLSFVVTASIVLAVIGHCTDAYQYRSKTIIHFQGHYVKWTTSIVLCLVLLCAVGEGILTDITRNTVTHPFLYTPQVTALGGAIMTLVYYHHMEYWNRPSLAWLLFLYWISAIVMETIRLVSLYKEIGFDIHILRFDVIITTIALYLLCLLVEVNLIRSKVFGWCYDEDHYPRDLERQNMYFFYPYTNMLSQMTFCSINWLFWLGYKKSLEIADLGCLPEQFTAQYQDVLFQKAYNKEKELAGERNKIPSLWKTYFHAYRSEILQVVAMVFVSGTIGVLPPLAVHGVITYASHLYYNNLPAYVFVAMVLLYLVLGVSALIGFTILVVLVPLQYKIVDYMSTIQKDVLKVSDERLKKSNELLQGIKLLKLYGWEEMFCSAVEVVRGKEIKKIMKAGGFMIIIIVLFQAIPVIVTFISFAIYSHVSDTPLTPALAFTSLALFNQLAWPLSRLIYTVGYLTMAIASTNRLEKFFAATELEDEDSGKMASRLLSDGFDGEYDDKIDGIDSDKLSEALDTLNGDVEMDMITERTIHNDKERLIADVSKAKSKYGSFKTVLTDARTFTTVNDVQLPVSNVIAVQINDGSFAWDLSQEIPTLSNICVDIPTGRLTMIVGLIGSGKSSLLSAIVGDMVTVSGTVQCNGTISYAPQKPWIQNNTIRNNIVFGKYFDFERYETVIKVCALRPDIDTMPAGDMTEIGEKGINLSGGQKQRVSVARALYSHAPIVMLDDPLSALDVHVGTHLMQQGIMAFLMKENRTVLLVTHHIQYLQYADKVIVMANGQIVKQGDRDDIEKHDPELLLDIQRKMHLDSKTGEEPKSGYMMGGCMEHEETQPAKLDMVEKRTENDITGSLIEKEERERGSVSWRIYQAYAKAIKYPWVVLILLLFLAQTTVFILNNFWLSAWSESGADIGNKSQEEVNEELYFYLGGYAALSFSYIGTATVTNSLYVICCLYGAKRMHIALIRNITHLPMRFFDTTPIGRILNRLSNDTHLIDQRLWLSMQSLLNSSLQCISALVVNTIVLPVFMLIAPILLVIYVIVMKIYITSSRELKRLDSITMSPVLAHFSETLGGLSTIRVFRDERRFVKRILKLVDVNNLVQLYLQTSDRWLAVRLELLGTAVILISGVSSLLTCVFSDLEPSLVGLSLTYALSMSGFLTSFAVNAGDCELQMNATERVVYYTRLKREKYQGVHQPPSTWPMKGDIRLENISARYASHLDPVLENITIHFKGGQKIGICGRTGSGKSSLTLALYRMIDTYKGTIYIDDVNISTIPLLTLRSRLAIIPQDPVLFSGTIRYNLDPEVVLSDKEIWDAIGLVQIKSMVLNLDEQLDHQINDDGDNFSVGERQLICLARAYLRKSQVLVMDEATASIDTKTDNILKNVIRTAFASRTVLTIAHRISTIMDSDMVVVLSKGQIKEYNTPQNLLSNEDSIFASLIKKSKPNTRIQICVMITVISI
ncbi:ATP-binding cassette sub-family C member 9-like [Glandiceps talaboti]